MNSNQENQQTNLGKNVQRIKLKKRSEANITPLQLVNAGKVPSLMTKRGSVPCQMVPPSMIKRESMHAPSGDWRISIIEPKPEDNTPSDVPPAISPDKKVRKFVGTGLGGPSDLMISAIKQDRIGLPGHDSDGDLDFVVEESGMMDRDDLKDLQSPFFEDLDDI